MKITRWTSSYMKRDMWNSHIVNEMYAGNLRTKKRCIIYIVYCHNFDDIVMYDMICQEIWCRSKMKFNFKISSYGCSTHTQCVLHIQWTV